MKQALHKRKIIAFVLLLFLSVSIAPKAFFHELLTSHQDVYSCNEPAQTTHHLHSESISCHFDNVVVTIPYESDVPQWTAFTESILIKSEIYFLSSTSQFPFFKKENKGPPTV